ncbi:MAG: DNA topoisomerase IV subunit B [Bifidobacteriaceae bacterium]|nr:DNA topoisomerase IV subunit B [Bifidobacteriaceae bacterium]
MAGQKATEQQATSEYSAKDLAVLEGLDAVRKRPGMYIGTTDSMGLMHCLWEIIDNSVDEALAGACDHIIITLHTDGSIEVADNGRGIPVDIEPKTKLSGVEVVLTRLHAGAKFGESSYNATGGLHGVGSSVVNALSSRLDVEVDRDGHTYRMEFHQGHPGVYADANPEFPSPFSSFKKTRKNRPTELRVIGDVPASHTGTRIRYWLDPEIFNDSAKFDYQMLIDRVRQTSFLVPGLRIDVVDENVPEDEPANSGASNDAATTTDEGEIVLVDAVDVTVTQTALSTQSDNETSSGQTALASGSETSAANETPLQESNSLGGCDGHPRVQEFLHKGGIVDFVDFLSHGEPVSDVWHITGTREYREETQQVNDNSELHTVEVSRTCDVDIALRWTNDYDTTIRSFVNVVETPGGGMHVDGFLNALAKQVRKAIENNARKYKISLKDPKQRIERDDVTAGLVAVITVRIAEPQFQGQTKDVLGTAQVKPIVSRLTNEQFGEMISGKKRGFKTQSEQVLVKIAGEMHARVQAHKAKEITRRKNALESASMPAKLSDCLPGNDDIAELFIVEGDSALGTAKAARNSLFQALLPIRGKILNVRKASLTQMLNNAECSAIIQVIGAGSGREFDISQARYNKVIMMTDADVDGAHIRILLLTLFYRYMRQLIENGRVYAAVPPLHRIALTGSHKGEFVYTYSEKELRSKLSELAAKRINYDPDVQRYKGLGEMDADQLADTTMDPRSRLLRRIRMEDAEKAVGVFDLLMGDEVPPRRQYIIDNADAFDRTQIDA